MSEKPENLTIPLDFSYCKSDYVNQADLTLSPTKGHLENRITALPSVQTVRNVTTSNGITATLLFSEKPDPQVQRNIAAMLVSAFEERNQNETCNVSVQSLY